MAKRAKTSNKSIKKNSKEKDKKKQKRNTSKKGKHKATSKKEESTSSKAQNKNGKRAIDKQVTKIENEKEKEEQLVKIQEMKEITKKEDEIPKEELQKINKCLFRNIIIAVGILLYFMFLILGNINIKQEVYITDLKVFSISILFIAIIIIENAYKKDSGQLAIYGIEFIVLSIVTLALIYFNKAINFKYSYLVLAISYLFAIYYLLKAIVMYIKMRRDYFMNHIKQIMDKDE